jgi:hypothetical protein
MSLNDILTRYLPRLQDVHTESKEFHVLTSFSYLSIGLLASLLLYRHLTPRDDKGGIRKLGGFPIFTAWTFFTKRYDFIRANFESDPSPHFKFNVLQVGPLSAVSLCPGLNIVQHSVVALRGEESRKAYFNNKNLSFTEGYRVLRGGVRPVAFYQ